MTSVSIVIPCYNHWELTHQLLFDIYKNCSPVSEVIVVDDKSPDKVVQDGLSWWANTHMLPIETVSLKENVGFLRAANTGLKAADGDVVCLVSNDVRVRKDLVAMSQGLAQIPGKVLLGGKVYSGSTGWNEFNGRVFPYVEGWLLIATKENWEELGYFDELFAPNDYEDIDLSTTAISLGYALAEITPDAGTVVEHVGAQTISYGDARESITKVNQKNFEAKWISKAK
jgi:GT2 family glycosyltransferase